MKSPTALAAAALLFACGCKQAVSPSPEYRPEQAGTLDHAMCLLGFTAVPLRELPTGHHLIEARINGRAGNFILDTGANATVVNEAQLGHFNVSNRSIGVGGAIGLGGAMNAKQVGIEKLAIGAVPIRQTRIIAADIGQISGILGPLAGGTVYGIIGQDVMKEHRAVIDVARPMLYLIRDDRDPAPVPAEQCRRDADEDAGEDSRGGNR